ncbi:MAG: DUF378 domain-containing protein [Clostridia bacterium]|nr:DUF378 domain-containing protein [Clostridia bacterium]
MTIIAIILTIIGSLNWLLVGVFGFNLVTFIFGAGAFTAVVYVLVGLAGIWMLYYLVRTKFRVDPIRDNVRNY